METTYTPPERSVINFLLPIYLDLRLWLGIVIKKMKLNSLFIKISGSFFPRQNTQDFLLKYFFVSFIYEEKSLCANVLFAYYSVLTYFSRIIHVCSKFCNKGEPVYSSHVLYIAQCTRWKTYKSTTIVYVMLLKQNNLANPR